MSEQPMDRKDLKIQALRERIVNLTAEHEDRAADYRVEITLISNDNQSLQGRIQELEQKVTQYEKSENDVTIKEDPESADHPD